MLIVFFVVFFLSRYVVNSFLKMSIYSLIKYIFIVHPQLPTYTRLKGYNDGQDKHTLCPFRVIDWDQVEFGGEKEFLLS